MQRARRTREGILRAYPSEVASKLTILKRFMNEKKIKILFHVKSRLLRNFLSMKWERL